MQIIDEDEINTAIHKNEWIEENFAKRNLLGYPDPDQLMIEGEMRQERHIE